MRRLTLLVVVLTATSLVTGAAAAAEEDGATGGTSGDFAAGQQITSANERPPMDTVGGFQLSIIGGVQLRGSASGSGGVALAYYKPSTGNVGLELEAVATRGPNGEIYHGLLSLILQSGTRAARMVPYLSLGGGMFYARAKPRDAVAEALPQFGIAPTEETETGPLIAVGFGIRYYLSDGISFRADYREFRALTSGDGGFFDRLYALRRIGGFLSFDF